MRILVIEDDPSMRELLKINLEGESFAVDTAEDGKRGSFLARVNDYDVIILDNILPFKLGIEVCEDIRKLGKTTPILLLSVQGEVEDKTKLLDAGVDDYMTKPHSHKELVSRIRALTRRPNAIQSEILQYGDIVLNSSTYQVTKGKKDVHLTTKEFSLLELLLKNKGRVVSRGAIMEHVWDSSGDPLSKTVEMHILNLRKKLEGGSKNTIVNVPGRGYKIDAY